MPTKAELQEALDRANAERSEDDQIVPDGANKGDLEKALADAGVEVDGESGTSGALFVSAPIVVVKTKGNRVVHLYKGDQVLGDVTEESLQNLRDLGYVSDEPQQ